MWRNRPEEMFEQIGEVVYIAVADEITSLGNQNFVAVDFERNVRLYQRRCGSGEIRNDRQRNCVKCRPLFFIPVFSHHSRHLH